jgi:SPP1 gp7 family putative phage head morphogenesis protein
MRIQDQATEFQNDLIDIEEESRRKIEQHYAEIYAALVLLFSEFFKQLRVLRARGQLGSTGITLNTIYPRIVQRVTNEFSQWSQFSFQEISDAQVKAVELSMAHSIALILSSIGTPQNPQEFIGHFLSTPGLEAFLKQNYARPYEYRAILDLNGPDLLNYFNTRIIPAIVNGEDLDKLAQELLVKLNEPNINTQTAASTEVIKAYRGSMLEQFRQSNVVEGWQWFATLDDKTCPICVALHGQVFSLDEPFASHPNCRCIPIPITFSFADIGWQGDDNPVRKIQTGIDWFDEQSEAAKEKRLGPGKYELFREGKISLTDLIGYRDHPVWGSVRFERNLRDLRK